MHPPQRALRLSFSPDINIPRAAILTLLSWAFALACSAQAQLAKAAAADRPLFNGKDLAGWDGDPRVWTVKDGAITAQWPAEPLRGGASFLKWKGGDVSDFELSWKYRLTPENPKRELFSMLCFRGMRSERVDPDAEARSSGYELTMFQIPSGGYSPVATFVREGRVAPGVLCHAGQIATVTDGSPLLIKPTGSFGNFKQVNAFLRRQWNDVKIAAQGNRLQCYLNNRQIMDVTDETTGAAGTGPLALQLPWNVPATFQVKELRLREIKVEAKTP